MLAHARGLPHVVAADLLSSTYTLSAFETHHATLASSFSFHTFRSVFDLTALQALNVGCWNGVTVQVAARLSAFDQHPSSRSASQDSAMRHTNRLAIYRLTGNACLAQTLP